MGIKFSVFYHHAVFLDVVRSFPKLALQIEIVKRTAIGVIDGRQTASPVLAMPSSCPQHAALVVLPFYDLRVEEVANQETPGACQPFLVARSSS